MNISCENSLSRVAVVLTSSVQVLSLPSLQRVALLRTPASSKPLCAIATDPNATQLLAAPAHRKGSLQLLVMFKSYTTYTRVSYVYKLKEETKI